MRTLHIVSHTHWDREWYLTFQQFRLKLVHLVDGLLDILESDPDYKFFMLDGQTIVLDDYLAVRPGREETLRHFVQTGRIIIGPWHILPDEFLVGPEATVRNLLQGERTARLFGPKMRIGYTPDPFGHIGQLPQILRGFGISQAAFRRGLGEEPCELWWAAPDGSRVLTAYLRDGYDNAASLPIADKEKFVSEVCRLRDNLLPHTASSHLLLMHGTDHMEPPPGTPAAIAYAEGKLGGDELIHSTLPEYMEAVQATVNLEHLPVVRGELRDPKRHHLLPGVLSTRMWIKQRNSACETLLEKWAEPFSTFSGRWIEKDRTSSLKNKAEILHSAWRLLMENHPHDSICGCSVDQVHAEMSIRFDQVQQIGEELTRQSLEEIASSVDTRGKDENLAEAIVVFNPDGSSRSDVVTATLELPATVRDFELVDENGAVLPYQVRGLANREIVNLALSPKEFQTSLGQVNEGRAAGMTVQDMTVRREGVLVFIEASMEDGGEPNLSVWHSGIEEIKKYLADPTVEGYRVHMRSVAATQLNFTAADVPGLGYRTFWVHATPKESEPIKPNALMRAVIPLGARLTGTKVGRFLIARLTRETPSKPPHRIENEFFSVKVEKDGTLILEDKHSQTTFTGLNHFVDGGDCGDEYNYAPPVVDRLSAARMKSVRVNRGTVQQSLELLLELETSAMLASDRKSRSTETVRLPITAHVTLAAGVPRLDIHTEVVNLAKDHRLRVHFPAPFPADSGTHDEHFDVVHRPIGIPAFDETWIEQPRPEVPQRAFSDVSDDRLGLMVANRGLPEVEVLRSGSGNAEIALTLLRCVGWLSRDDFSTRKGHAGPMMETPAAQMLGKWSFDYSVLPHTGDWRAAYTQAYAFRTPLRAIGTGIHPGTLPSGVSFLEVEPPEFVISAVKEAEPVREDGGSRGWLVRGYNILGEDIQVTLYPIRAWRYAELVNLAEEKQSDLNPGRDGRVRFTAHPHQIVTVMFRE